MTDQPSNAYVCEGPLCPKCLKPLDWETVPLGWTEHLGPCSIAHDRYRVMFRASGHVSIYPPHTMNKFLLGPSYFAQYAEQLYKEHGIDLSESDVWGPNGRQFRFSRYDDGTWMFECVPLVTEWKAETDDKE